MREVTVYYAYDDTEFDNREECEQYESKTFDLLMEIFNAYEFFDENGQELFIFLNEIEEGLGAFEWAIEKSSQIKMKHILSNEAINFLEKEIGYIIPPNEIGTYGYNWKKKQWIKVDE